MAKDLRTLLGGVGWTTDGRVVIGSGGVDRRATLWTAKPGAQVQTLPFDYCAPTEFLSVFALEQEGRIGLAVWCPEGPGHRMPSLGMRDLRVEELAAVETSINGDPGRRTAEGMWSTATTAASASPSFMLRNSRSLACVSRE